MTVEIEFTREGQIRRDFEIAGTAKNRVMEVDVVLLDRFVALVQHLMFLPFFVVNSLAATVLTFSLSVMMQNR